MSEHDKPHRSRIGWSSSPGWARFRLIFLFALLVSSIVGWLLFSDGIDDGGSSTVGMRVLSVRELYPDALEAARQWRGDAVLSYATASFRPSESPGGLTAGLGFRSASEPGIYLLVWFRESSGDTQMEVHEGSNPPDRPVGEAIDPLQLPFDTAQALEMALQAGGAEFLSEHPTINWPQSLTLEYEDLFYSQGSVLWIVRLLERGTLEHAEVAIDALTGEVVEQ